MNKIKTIIAALMATATLTSCSDWLDVSPKSQIKEEDHFSREGGYKDQLTGVYTAMSQQTMYGLNMGIGFVEVLSHSYDVDANGKWRYANEFDYKNSDVESTIASIWQQTYNCIANLNILIRNIDQADKSMFTDNNYHLYRGEAYGLRAFLHFDLMRLFACAPSMDKTAKGVPYVTEYSTEVVPQKSVEETMNLIIADLKTAREDLAHDSIVASQSAMTIYNNSSLRTPYFNYFAATLTLARAYMWLGDKQNALQYANEIVSTLEGTNPDRKYSPFRWIDPTNMQSTNRNELDMAFTCEHIFHLKINNWEDIANYYFTSKGGSNSLTPSDDSAQDIYEVPMGYGNDYRYLKAYEQDGEKRYACKFWYLDGSKYNNIYPLLRMTEAYYIAAECLKDSDPKGAITLLNTVRENRNLYLFPLADNLNADEIQNEIYKEYRKEFVGEAGQLFFYYKRLNATSIKGASVVPGKGVYVLPIPANDAEFGGYEN